jgi:hypothetical protein
MFSSIWGFEMVHMRFLQATILLGILAISPAAFSHHSDAGIDEFSEVALEGRVTEFRFRQPHVFLAVETEQNGETVEWDVQMVSVNILMRRGWSADSLKVGDRVSLSVNPAENGRPYGKLIDIVRADGSAVTVDPNAPEARLAVATSLHGNWTGNRPVDAPAPPPRPEPAPAAVSENEEPPCTSGFDCFFKENLVLNQAGIAARDAYDPLSEENPEATCVGRPTPSALMSARGYLIQLDLSEAEEKIYIRSEWFNEERTVWMDGRDHPNPSTTLQTGHSIGWWEGDTLVVDTKNFDDHRSPYQIGVPSGSQKHVVERYTLSEEGTSMQVNYVLEDPEFLAEPLNHTNNLFHAPHMQMHAMDCDPENTGRFLN